MHPGTGINYFEFILRVGRLSGGCCAVEFGELPPTALYRERARVRCRTGSNQRAGFTTARLVCFSKNESSLDGKCSVVDVALLFVTLQWRLHNQGTTKHHPYKRPFPHQSNLCRRPDDVCWRHNIKSK